MGHTIVIGRLIDPPEGTIGVEPAVTRRTLYLAKCHIVYRDIETPVW